MKWTYAEFFVTQTGRFRLIKFDRIMTYLFRSYPTALELVATGKVNVKPLITHRFKLEESVKAFETARTGDGGAIKVMISCKD